MQTLRFKYVRCLWKLTSAEKLAGDEVELLLYRSNLLGSERNITNYGGGNTSCKVDSIDPLTGMSTEVMWVKGSGGNLATLARKGLASLYVDRLRNLKEVYRGLAYEDEMVGLINRCAWGINTASPSIDTPLHGFLPFKHIDHLHPDSVIAIAASKEGKQITKELFEGAVGWVDWQRPGFDLGLKLLQQVDKHPGMVGIILGGHGLITWGDSSYQCYLNSLELIERCATYIQSKYSKKPLIFGGRKIKSLPRKERLEIASSIAPVLRGYCSSNSRMIGHFTDDERVLKFITSQDMQRLAAMGTSCPDHFLRTKIKPMILHSDDDNTGKLRVKFEAYRKMYADYYKRHSRKDSPPMRDPNPVIILYPGIGMFSFAKDKQTARVAAEFYINAINVMKGAETISEYTSLPEREAFHIEYWSLEEAKLKQMPPPKALTGKIALITGGAGGIGKAIAKKFASEGACIMLMDKDEKRLELTYNELTKHFGKDVIASEILDVTVPASIKKTIRKTVLEFGGLDILVNSAGISISKPLGEHSIEDWDKLYDIMVKGQFLMTKAAVEIMRKQDRGGDIINIVSKNAIVSGINNAGYGSAKAAQLHLSRLSAAELGKDKIRVNVVNPDAVIQDSKIWEGEWAGGRAKAYGIKTEELPGYYAKRTLLNEVILPEDIANACFAFAGGLLNKSTGNILNVDGGIASAFVR